MATVPNAPGAGDPTGSPPSPLPLPPHYDPARVGTVFKVDYEARARDAATWAAAHAVAPAASDRLRIALLAVDVQNTFCTPGFELFVGGRSGTGAVDDNRHLCAFLYRNLGSITQVLPTLDTHQALQIFHAAFLIDADGNHPSPLTQIDAAAVAAGRWRIDPRAAAAVGLAPEAADRYLAHYVGALEASGKYALTVWPYHAMLGGIGHALAASFEEAVFFHAVARAARVDFHVKGNEPLTEHYSVLGPEVTTGPGGAPIGHRHEALARHLLDFDAVIIAGQAKSHCVAWTIDDLLTHIAARDRTLAERVYLLEDCSSPVVVPGIVDYTGAADAAFARFAAAGMHVVRSTEPLATWPGLAGRARLAG